MWEMYFREFPVGVWYTLAALLLLFYPRHLYRLRLSRRKTAARAAATTPDGKPVQPGERRKLVFRARSYEGDLPHQDDISVRQALRQLPVWLDFFRAAVGAHALCFFGLSFTWVEPRTAAGAYRAAAFVGIATLAILVQMMRRKDRIAQLAVPVAFILGLCIGYFKTGPIYNLQSLLIAAISLVLLLSAKPVLSGPGPVLFVYILCFALASYFFVGPLGAGYALPVTAALCAFPLALHLLFGRPMYFETPPRELREGGRERSRSSARRDRPVTSGPKA
jgi:hypothetical protein